MNLLLLNLSVAIFIISFLIVLLPLIFYLASAQKTLHSVSPQNRIMKPGIVWLVLVPFFGYFWLFKVTDALTINTNIDLSGYGLSQKDTMQTTGLG